MGGFCDLEFPDAVKRVSLDFMTRVRALQVLHSTSGIAQVSTNSIKVKSRTCPRTDP